MRIAVTGHRPDKLGGYKTCALHDSVKDSMHELLAEYLDKHGKDLEVISGMALGVDQWWAQAALHLDIPVIAAIPFEGFERKWPSASQRKFSELLAACSEVHHVSEPEYAAWKMQARNEWMIRQCDLLVAYYIPQTQGGTANALAFANNSGKAIKLIDVSKLKGYAERQKY